LEKIQEKETKTFLHFLVKSEEKSRNWVAKNDLHFAVTIFVPLLLFFVSGETFKVRNFVTFKGK
jgi:hypothetical protein